MPVEGCRPTAMLELREPENDLNGVRGTASSSPPAGPVGTTGSGGWMHAWAGLTAVATFLLLALGSVVTTLRVGMADPIWPTYPWHLFLIDWHEPSTGFLIEHSHRLAGYVVGCCTIGLMAASGERAAAVGLLAGNRRTGRSDLSGAAGRLPYPAQRARGNRSGGDPRLFRPAGVGTDGDFEPGHLPLVERSSRQAGLDACGRAVAALDVNIGRDRVCSDYSGRDGATRFLDARAAGASVLSPSLWWRP